MENKIKYIAEIAQGYEGKYKLAKKLLDATIRSNADIVKYQLVDADELSTTDYKHYKFFKKLKLGESDWFKLIKFSKKKGLKFFFDIFGKNSLHLAEKLKVDGIKIHPTDINNIQLLKRIKNSKIKKVILGVGGAKFSEIKDVYKLLKNKKIILMLGFQSYPTPNNENNLLKINFLKKKFGKKIEYGYADHSIIKESYITSICAVSLGARYIEKHITIKSSRPLEDSESAIQKDAFKDFIYKVNFAHSACGSNKNNNKYILSKNELSYKKNIKRCLVTTKSIKKNFIFKNMKYLTLKRSSKNFLIYNLSEIKNKKLNFNLKNNTPLLKKYFR